MAGCCDYCNELSGFIRLREFRDDRRKKDSAPLRWLNGWLDGLMDAWLVGLLVAELVGNIWLLDGLHVTIYRMNVGRIVISKTVSNKGGNLRIT